jgi:hypothetical protein
MPGLEFYELRHRALQWMIDPPHDGGLGLDIQTAAHIAGHHDGGYLVCSTYSKLAEHRALTRTRRAIDAYQQRVHDLPPGPAGVAQPLISVARCNPIAPKSFVGFEQVWLAREEPAVARRGSLGSYRRYRQVQGSGRVSLSSTSSRRQLGER